MKNVSFFIKNIQRPTALCAFQINQKIMTYTPCPDFVLVFLHRPIPDCLAKDQDAWKWQKSAGFAYVPPATFVACCRYAIVTQLWALPGRIGKRPLGSRTFTSSEMEKKRKTDRQYGLGEVATPLRISGNAQICAHQQHLRTATAMITAATLFQLATAMHALKYAKCLPLASCP